MSVFDCTSINYFLSVRTSVQYFNWKSIQHFKQSSFLSVRNNGAAKRWFKKLLSALCITFFALASTQAYAHGHHSHDSGAIQVIAVTELPPEVRDTLRLIKQGGPFSFPRDGVVFANFEHRLPKQLRGYYHEYTVKTPGARNRGARRIVCGLLPECYYSGDHYRTFLRIKE